MAVSGAKSVYFSDKVKSEAELGISDVPMRRLQVKKSYNACDVDKKRR